jgi:hypothetical protein
MPVRSRPIRIAGIASMSAMLLFAGREVCAQQVGTLTNTRGLDFGRFVAGTGGNVVVSAAGARSRTGGVILLNSPSANSASFAVGKSGGGKPLKTVIFTLPSDTAVRLTSGSNSMAVTTFTSSPAADISNNLTTTTTVTVGATLKVGANQAPGNYSGSFSLIANYQ